MCSGCVNCKNQATAYCTCGKPLSYSSKYYNRQQDLLQCGGCNKYWSVKYIRSKTNGEVGVVYL